MSDNPTPAGERGLALIAELDQITDTFGADRSAWPAGQRERAERLEVAIRRASRDADDEAAAEARRAAVEENRRNGVQFPHVTDPVKREQILRAMADPSLRSNGFGAGPAAYVEAMNTRRDPWRDLDEHITRQETPGGFVARAHDALSMTAGLSDRARGMLADTIDGRDGGTAAQFVVARSNPAYASAFAKVLANPERAFLTFTRQESAAFAAVEATRALLGTGTGTGGYTIPLALDPNLAAIVNNGAANPFRSLATVKQALSSPHRAITSAGITAEWTAEGVAFGDNTPTFGKVDIPLHKLTAYVNASYELMEDAGATVMSTIPVLLADARDRAEAEAFATGSGSGAPKGIVTALAAASAFVTATTRGQFNSASSVDTLALFNALPARARQSGKLAWLMNNGIRTTIAQQTIGTYGALVAEMVNTRTILGAPVLEASAMTSATTSGSHLAVLADMGAYQIADSIAGPSLEFVPIQFDQATGRPNGTRGWLYHQRTGADYLDATQGRILLA